MAKRETKDEARRTTPLRPFVVAGSGLLAVSLLIDLVVGLDGAFGFDGRTGFYAVFGFVAGLAVIGLAKAIGALLKRPVSYYGDDG